MMKPALLHAILRISDARTPDADLLAQFAQSRDAHAFEELVRRHGPLVWSVCRQLLPNHADAEDAFQAVFLALMQGARTIRAGQALPAWLHGVAFRVAGRSKRAACRRRLRESKAAVLEADRPIPDATWASLMAAVHEEVQKLPDPERAAFVLCELEGVRQSDAAERLGWPLGTFSGRLCKARQRLIDRLSHRGIVPGVLLIGGAAGTAAVVPPALAAKVNSFPSLFPNGFSPTVAALARGLAGGSTMRLKLLTAAVVVAGAFGITTGSALLSQAEAQNFVPLAGTQLGPPPRATTTTTTDLQVTLGGGGQAAADPAVALPTTATTITTGGPGMMAVVVGEMKWDYKFVDLTNNDRDSFEKEIRQAGSQGWEFCGSERLMKKANEGQALVLVFKKQHGTPAAVMGQASGFGGPGNQAGGSSGYGFGPRGMAPAPQPTPGGSGAPSATPAPGGGMSRGTTNTFQVDQQRSVYTSDTDKLVAVFKLHHVDATNVARALTTGFYANKNVMIVAEPVSNTILVAANDGVYQQIKKTIEELDAPSNKPFPTPPPRPEPAASTGTTTVYPNPRPTAEARGVALPAQGTQKVGEGHPTSTPKPLLPSVNAPGAGEAVTVMDVRFARVEELSMTLSRVFPEARITFDQRTNQLIFQADPEATQEITKLVKKLDVDVPAKNGR